MEPNGNHKIRIVDRWGHTLCYYDGSTNAIEIKATTRRGGQQSTKGEVYAIHLGTLLSAVQENQSASEPVCIFIANVMEPSCKP